MASSAFRDVAGDATEEGRASATHGLDDRDNPSLSSYSSMPSLSSMPRVDRGGGNAPDSSADRRRANAARSFPVPRGFNDSILTYMRRCVRLDNEFNATSGVAPIKAS